MTKVEHLEKEIRDLSPEELATFREWFVAFDAVAWDSQIELDISNGKLNDVANAALAAHRAGQSRPL